MTWQGPGRPDRGLRYCFGAGGQHAAAAKRVGDVASLALLQQDHANQEEAHQDVERYDQLVEHRGLHSLSPEGTANQNYTTGTAAPAPQPPPVKGAPAVRSSVVVGRRKTRSDLRAIP